MLFYGFYRSPLGRIKITATTRAVVSIELKPRPGELGPAAAKNTPLIKRAVRELKEYFKGNRKKFDFKLDPQGTVFQKKIWQAMRKIPYGHTLSYGELARAAGFPKSSRAAGGACNKNPILLAIPCHRVVASQGKLGGFGCGIKNKLALLRLEARS